MAKRDIESGPSANDRDDDPFREDEITERLRRCFACRLPVGIKRADGTIVVVLSDGMCDACNDGLPYAS